MSSSPFPVSAEKEWEPKWEMWSIDQNQLAEFLELFRDIDVRREGFITGEQAKLVFSSSGLPKDVLGKIWFVQLLTFIKFIPFKEFGRPQSRFKIR